MDTANRQLADLHIALVGVPNCGKTALFNRLTGSRQKVANYPGVTVERKEGGFRDRGGRRYRVLDLPGAYSLSPTTLDEAITRDVVLGRVAGERQPDVIVCVADATHMPLSLRLILEVRRLGYPMVIALNRSDLARKRGFRLDVAKLAAALGVPVIETVAIAPAGAEALIQGLAAFEARSPLPVVEGGGAVCELAPNRAETERTQQLVPQILAEVGYREPLRTRAAARADAILMHPAAGMLVLGAVLFLVFQAVFSWAAWPMDLIEEGVGAFGLLVSGILPAGALQSLLVNGIIAGVGSVIVFLPQILILFFFILVLEDSGYLPRAAYLLDRLMGGVGLSGRAFIPLLSSFACAIPGIMAARTIPSARDRIATIMIAPLMTCSARLPVYALLIAAFIPARAVGPFNLQGLVLFTLYFAGVLAALGVAWVMKRFLSKRTYHPLLLELPDYQWPDLRSLAMGLWDRVRIFMRRVGGIILSLMIVLWFLSSYPAAPPGATGPAIEYSFAGMLGRALHVVFAPIGFNWQIAVALVPGLAAREVAVSALGTVYAMSASNAALESALLPVISSTWSLGTGLSLLAWYIFAPQCLSTLAVVKRETQSWRYPLIMAGYLFALAYLASFITWRVTLALTS
ncbi:MAG TPA: ferrous iron transporter B [Steroidobacteraceae bacterium]|nr:ferrous iron transporter B [Steroidobacteraceae bacterium]HQX46453.1 ferrous iron transporter B [Steroidobacteraceae bacterium]HQX78307.1 ferrous iron transporter B [Steroidobacteraceae bacterium]HQZ80001.1 ferrous iron transporter B [Steroidobacteraceae bacterium]